MAEDGKAAGPTALVTGGASGIGAATVEVLLEKGWRVAILDLEGSGLAAARERYRQRRDVHMAAVDVTDEAAVESAVLQAEAALGPIEGVVNCAGIAADRHVLDTPAEVFRRILDVNVVGTFIVGRACARQMRQRRRGAIVNLASVSGMRGNKGRVAYGASKGAVANMTQVMANDLAEDGIRVNAVAPGPIDTPLIKALHTDKDRALWSSYVPMNRYAEPREVAEVIAFLLDGKVASYMTGAIVPVDGGFSSAGLIVREREQRG